MLERILIAGDQANSPQVLARALRRRGYHVAAAQTRCHALQRLRHEAFDLLVTDVRMADMSSSDLLRQARDTVPGITVLVMMGDGNVESAVQAMELGAEGLVRIPGSIDELVSAIDAALARDRLRKEKARLQALAPLLELSRLFLCEVEEGGLLRLVCEAVAGELNASSVEMLCQDGCGKLVRQAAHGLPDAAVGAAVEDDTALEAMGRLEVTASPELETGGADWPHHPQDHVVYVPLATRTTRLGVARVSRRGEGAAFNESEVELLSAECVANRRLLEGLERKQAEVESLLHEVVETGESQRTALAMDLHDGPVQSIVASQYEVQTSKLLLDRRRLAEARSKLEGTQQMLTEAVRSLRAIVYDLQGATAVDRGLVAAVSDLLAGFDAAGSLRGRVEVVGTERPLTREAAREVYYITREAVANARKHSGSMDVLVRVVFGPKRFAVTVSDNGGGFDSSRQPGNEAGHLGMRSMMQRARMLGGKLSIRSTPGRGTTVRLTVPFRPGAELEGGAVMPGEGLTRAQGLSAYDDGARGISARVGQGGRHQYGQNHGIDR